MCRFLSGMSRTSTTGARHDRTARARAVCFGAERRLMETYAISAALLGAFFLLSPLAMNWWKNRDLRNIDRPRQQVSNALNKETP